MQKGDTYLHDCSFSDAPPLCSPTGIASSSEEVNSITLVRFGGGDARFGKPLPLELCAILLSSLALDLCSPAGRLCWRSAATSTSNSGVVVGDVALRFPARSLGLTIFGGGCKHPSVEADTRTESEDRGCIECEGGCAYGHSWPYSHIGTLWLLETYSRGQTRGGPAAQAAWPSSLGSAEATKF